MKTKKKQETPTPRIAALNKMSGIMAEMGKVYREARRGELDIEKATKFTYMLREMRVALESTEIEKRMDALEQEAKTK